MGGDLLCCPPYDFQIGVRASMPSGLAEGGGTASVTAQSAGSVHPSLATPAIRTHLPAGPAPSRTKR